MKPLGLSLLLLLGGCVDRSLESGRDAHGADSGQTAQTTSGCTGKAPDCVPFCESDWIQQQATCEDAGWACPAGLMRLDQCPPSACFGPAASDAEMCGPSGWECHPTMNDYDTCPEFLCPECTGFEGPVTVGTCTCACDTTSGGAEVRCTRGLGS